MQNCTALKIIIDIYAITLLYKYYGCNIVFQDSDILNLGTGSFSWWHVNGPGCKAVYDVTEPELFRPARPTNVTDCVLDYEVIEILHAATQCILGVSREVIIT